MLKRTLLFACLSLLFAGSAVAQLPDTVVGKRMAGFIDVLNTKDQGKLQAFIAANFSVAALKERSAEARATRIINFAKEEAPIKVIDVLDENKGRLIVAISHASGRELGIRMELEPAEPYGIERLLVAPTDALKDMKPPKEYKNWATLAELAEQVRADAESPAIVVGRAREGTPAEVAVSGKRAQGGSEAATAADRWLLGSIGKSLTATIIGKLIEEGKLDWDTPLSKALPNTAMRPDLAGITIEQVLQHRSGLIQGMNFNMADVMKMSGGRSNPVDIRESYVRYILDQAPIAKPTERFAYSNAGYAVLSHIAETIEGVPFETLMRDRLFKPLGMDSAMIATPGTAGMPGSSGQPAGHRAGPNGLVRDTFRDGKLPAMMAGAGGGVACTMSDLLKFGQFHLNGLKGHDGYLKASTIKRLHTPRYAKAGEEPYSAGWSRLEGLGGSAEWHNGSDGTMRADLAIYVEKGLVVAAIINRGGESDPSPALQAVQAIAAKG